MLPIITPCIITGIKNCKKKGHTPFLARNMLLNQWRSLFKTFKEQLSNLKRVAFIIMKYKKNIDLFIPLCLITCLICFAGGFLFATLLTKKTQHKKESKQIE
jgi:hypothetical protein